MLLFGFSVLAVLLCVLPGDVFPGDIGTSDVDHEGENVKQYGIFGNYCQKSRNNSYSWSSLSQLNYPPTPTECCNDPELRCKKYINPGETKFGVRNEDDSWPMLECICEHKLFTCLIKNMTADDASRVSAMLYPETCFKATACEGKTTLGCDPEYKAMSVRTSFSHRRVNLI